MRSRIFISVFTTAVVLLAQPCAAESVPTKLVRQATEPLTPAFRREASQIDAHIRPVAKVELPSVTTQRLSNFSPDRSTVVAGRGIKNESPAPNAVSAKDVMNRWNDHLGPGPHTNLHPRTGAVEPDRIVSADKQRSIRYGSHESTSSPNKHHYHEETWTKDAKQNVMNVDDKLVRIKKK